MRKTLYFRTFALLTLLAFSISGNTAAYPVPQPESFPQTLPIDFDHLSVPEELGHIEEVHSGGSQSVIYIQDAHGVLDAQENIQKLIRYFQEKYKIHAVAVEGSRGTLDPLLMRSFPDEFVKNKVMREYLERGEISGVDLASIFNKEKAVYYGLEDWRLYQENYIAYAEAQQNQKKLLDKIGAIEDAWDQKRRQIYTVEFNRFHEKKRDFNDDKLGLFEFAKYLNELEGARPAGGKFITEEKTPQLFKLLQAVGKDREDTEDLDASIRKMADLFGKKFAPKLPLDKSREFNKRYQNYRTGMEDAGVFLRFLVETGKSAGLKPKLSHAMREALGQVETLTMIKGTKMFEELHWVLAGYENEFAATPEQKELAANYNKLRLLKEMSRLELTRDDLELYQKDAESYLKILGDSRELVTPALEFYRAALERDEVFIDKIKTIFRKENPGALIVLTGGFHAEGMHRNIKKENYSYVILTPKMTSLAGHEGYLRVMSGDLSYKEYLKKSFYDAFIKHASRRLVKEMNEPDFKKTLKLWRDQVIRELAAEGRTGDAPEYNAYIDELFRVYKEKYGDQVRIAKTREEILEGIDDRLAAFNQSKKQQMWGKFESNVKVFMAGINKLLARGPLTPEKVQGLAAEMDAYRSGLAAPDIESAKDPADLIFRLRSGHMTLGEAKSEVRSVFGTQAVGNFSQFLTDLDQQLSGPVVAPAVRAAANAIAPVVKQRLERELPAVNPVENAGAAANQNFTATAAQELRGIARTELGQNATPQNESLTARTALRLAAGQLNQNLPGGTAIARSEIRAAQLGEVFKEIQAAYEDSEDRFSNGDYEKGDELKAQARKRAEQVIAGAERRAVRGEKDEAVAFTMLIEKKLPLELQLEFADRLIKLRQALGLRLTESQQVLMRMRENSEKYRAGDKDAVEAVYKDIAPLVESVVPGAATALYPTAYALGSVVNLYAEDEETLGDKVYNRMKRVVGLILLFLNNKDLTRALSNRASSGPVKAAAKAAVPEAATPEAVLDSTAAKPESKGKAEPFKEAQPSRIYQEIEFWTGKRGESTRVMIRLEDDLITVKADEYQGGKKIKEAQPAKRQVVTGAVKMTPGFGLALSVQPNPATKKLELFYKAEGPLNDADGMAAFTPAFAPAPVVLRYPANTSARLLMGRQFAFLSVDPNSGAPQLGLRAFAESREGDEGKNLFILRRGDTVAGSDLNSEIYLEGKETAPKQTAFTVRPNGDVVISHLGGETTSVDVVTVEGALVIVRMDGARKIPRTDGRGKILKALISGPATAKELSKSARLANEMAKAYPGQKNAESRLAARLKAFPEDALTSSPEFQRMIDDNPFYAARYAASVYLKAAGLKESEKDRRRAEMIEKAYEFLKKIMAKKENGLLFLQRAKDPSKRAGEHNLFIALLGEFADDGELYAELAKRAEAEQAPLIVSGRLKRAESLLATVKTREDYEKVSAEIDRNLNIARAAVETRRRLGFDVTTLSAQISEFGVKLLSLTIKWEGQRGRTLRAPLRARYAAEIQKTLNWLKGTNLLTPDQLILGLRYRLADSSASRSFDLNTEAAKIAGGLAGRVLKIMFNFENADHAVAKDREAMQALLDALQEKQDEARSEMRAGALPEVQDIVGALTPGLNAAQAELIGQLAAESVYDIPVKMPSGVLEVGKYKESNGTAETARYVYEDLGITPDKRLEDFIAGRDSDVALLFGDVLRARGLKFRALTLEGMKAAAAAVLQLRKLGNQAAPAAEANPWVLQLAYPDEVPPQLRASAVYDPARLAADVEKFDPAKGDEAETVLWKLEMLERNQAHPTMPAGLAARLPQIRKNFAQKQMDVLKEKLGAGSLAVFDGVGDLYGTDNKPVFFDAATAAKLIEEGLLMIQQKSGLKLIPVGDVADKAVVSKLQTASRSTGDEFSEPVTVAEMLKRNLALDRAGIDESASLDELTAALNSLRGLLNTLDPGEHADFFEINLPKAANLERKIAALQAAKDQGLKLAVYYPLSLSGTVPSNEELKSLIPLGREIFTARNKLTGKWYSLRGMEGKVDSKKLVHILGIEESDLDITFHNHPQDKIPFPSFSQTSGDLLALAPGADNFIVAGEGMLLYSGNADFAEVQEFIKLTHFNEMGLFTDQMEDLKRNQKEKYEKLWRKAIDLQILHGQLYALYGRAQYESKSAAEFYAQPEVNALLERMEKELGVTIRFAPFAGAGNENKIEQLQKMKKEPLKRSEVRLNETDLTALVKSIDPNLTVLKWFPEGDNGIAAEVKHAEFSGRRMVLKIQKDQGQNMAMDVVHMLKARGVEAAQAHLPKIFGAYAKIGDEYKPVPFLNDAQKAVSLEDLLASAPLTLHTLADSNLANVRAVLMEYVDGVEPRDAFYQGVFRNEDFEVDAPALNQAVAELYDGLAAANFMYIDNNPGNLRLVETDGKWRIVALDIGGLEDIDLSAVSAFASLRKPEALEEAMAAAIEAEIKRSEMRIDTGNDANKQAVVSYLGWMGGAEVLKLLNELGNPANQQAKGLRDLLARVNDPAFVKALKAEARADKYSEANHSAVREIAESLVRFPNLLNELQRIRSLLTAQPGENAFRGSFDPQVMGYVTSLFNAFYGGADTESVEKAAALYDAIDRTDFPALLRHPAIKYAEANRQAIAAIRAQLPKFPQLVQEIQKARAVLLPAKGAVTEFEAPRQSVLTALQNMFTQYYGGLQADSNEKILAFYEALDRTDFTARSEMRADRRSLEKRIDTTLQELENLARKNMSSEGQGRGQVARAATGFIDQLRRRDLSDERLKAILYEGTNGGAEGLIARELYGLKRPDSISQALDLLTRTGAQAPAARSLALGALLEWASNRGPGFESAMQAAFQNNEAKLGTLLLGFLLDAYRNNEEPDARILTILNGFGEVSSFTSAMDAQPGIAARFVDEVLGEFDQTPVIQEWLTSLIPLKILNKEFTRAANVDRLQTLKEEASGGYVESILVNALRMTGARSEIRGYSFDVKDPAIQKLVSMLDAEGREQDIEAAAAVIAAGLRQSAVTKFGSQEMAALRLQLPVVNGDVLAALFARINQLFKMDVTADKAPVNASDPAILKLNAVPLDTLRPADFEAAASAAVNSLRRAGIAKLTAPLVLQFQKQLALYNPEVLSLLISRVKELLEQPAGTAAEAPAASAGRIKIDTQNPVLAKIQSATPETASRADLNAVVNFHVQEFLKQGIPRLNAEVLKEFGEQQPGMNPELRDEVAAYVKYSLDLYPDGREIQLVRVGKDVIGKPLIMPFPVDYYHGTLRSDAKDSDPIRPGSDGIVWYSANPKDRTVLGLAGFQPDGTPKEGVTPGKVLKKRLILNDDVLQVGDFGPGNDFDADYAKSVADQGLQALYSVDNQWLAVVESMKDKDFVYHLNKSRAARGKPLIRGTEAEFDRRHAVEAKTSGSQTAAAPAQSSAAIKVDLKKLADQKFMTQTSATAKEKTEAANVILEALRAAGVSKLGMAELGALKKQLTALDENLFAEVVKIVQDALRLYPDGRDIQYAPVGGAENLRLIPKYFYFSPDREMANGLPKPNAKGAVPMISNPAEGEGWPKFELLLKPGQMLETGISSLTELNPAEAGSAAVGHFDESSGRLYFFTDKLENLKRVRSEMRSEPSQLLAVLRDRLDDSEKKTEAGLAIRKAIQDGQDPRPFLQTFAGALRRAATEREFKAVFLAMYEIYSALSARDAQPLDPFPELENIFRLQLVFLEIKPDYLKEDWQLYFNLLLNKMWAFPSLYPVAFEVLGEAKRSLKDAETKNNNERAAFYKKFIEILQNLIDGSAKDAPADQDYQDIKPVITAFAPLTGANLERLNQKGGTEESPYTFRDDTQRYPFPALGGEDAENTVLKARIYLGQAARRWARKAAALEGEGKSGERYYVMASLWKRFKVEKQALDRAVTIKMESLADEPSRRALTNRYTSDLQKMALEYTRIVQALLTGLSPDDVQKLAHIVFMTDAELTKTYPGINPENFKRRTAKQLWWLAKFGNSEAERFLNLNPKLKASAEKWWAKEVESLARSEMRTGDLSSLAAPLNAVKEPLLKNTAVFTRSTIDFDILKRYNLRIQIHDILQKMAEGESVELGLEFIQGMNSQLANTQDTDNAFYLPMRAAFDFVNAVYYDTADLTNDTDAKLAKARRDFARFAKKDDPSAMEMLGSMDAIIQRRKEIDTAFSVGTPTAADFDTTGDLDFSPKTKAPAKTNKDRNKIRFAVLEERHENDAALWEAALQDPALNLSKVLKAEGVVNVTLRASVVRDWNGLEKRVYHLSGRTEDGTKRYFTLTVTKKNGGPLSKDNAVFDLDPYSETRTALRAGMKTPSSDDHEPGIRGFLNEYAGAIPPDNGSATVTIIARDKKNQVEFVRLAVNGDKEGEIAGKPVLTALLPAESAAVERNQQVLLKEANRLSGQAVEIAEVRTFTVDGVQKSLIVFRAKKAAPEKAPLPVPLKKAPEPAPLPAPVPVPIPVPVPAPTPAPKTTPDSTLTGKPLAPPAPLRIARLTSPKFDEFANDVDALVHQIELAKGGITKDTAEGRLNRINQLLLDLEKLMSELMPRSVEDALLFQKRLLRLIDSLGEILDAAAKANPTYVRGRFNPVAWFTGKNAYDKVQIYQNFLESLKELAELSVFEMSNLESSMLPPRNYTPFSLALLLENLENSEGHNFGETFDSLLKDRADGRLVPFKLKSTGETAASKILKARLGKRTKGWDPFEYDEVGGLRPGDYLVGRFDGKSDGEPDFIFYFAGYTEAFPENAITEDSRAEGYLYDRRTNTLTFGAFPITDVHDEESYLSNAELYRMLDDTGGSVRPAHFPDSSVKPVPLDTSKQAARSEMRADNRGRGSKTSFGKFIGFDSPDLAAKWTGNPTLEALMDNGRQYLDNRVTPELESARGKIMEDLRRLPDIPGLLVTLDSDGFRISLERQYEGYAEVTEIQGLFSDLQELPYGIFDAGVESISAVQTDPAKVASHNQVLGDLERGLKPDETVALNLSNASNSKAVADALKPLADSGILGRLVVMFSELAKINQRDFNFVVSRRFVPINKSESDVVTEVSKREVSLTGVPISFVLTSAMKLDGVSTKDVPNLLTTLLDSLPSDELKTLLFRTAVDVDLLVKQLPDEVKPKNSEALRTLLREKGFSKEVTDSIGFGPQGFLDIRVKEFVDAFRAGEAAKQAA